MVKLENAALKACFDEKGSLIYLENKLDGRGNIICRPEGLFRLVCHLNDNWEHVVEAAEQKIVVVEEKDSVCFEMGALRGRSGAEMDIHARFFVGIEEDRLLFSAKVDNRSGAEITDFSFPRIGAIGTLGDGKPDLIWPYESGQRITNICERLLDLGRSSDGPYVLSMSYPGLASMCWMGLVDGEQSLYLGSHDDKHHVTLLRAIGSEAADATLEIDTLAFVRPGEAWECPTSVLMLYTGDWKKGADCYAQWAKGWRTPAKQSQWVRDMTGYFLVINKQQYGDGIWPYDTLPELYAYAKENGCDTLGLFGWYDTGHDNGYPDLTASDSMGGAENLKRQIKAVQADGGRVTLYYQGHLLDLGSVYYRTIGHRLEAKTRWRTPYFEEYSKYARSGYLQHFSKKLFATVCPSCPEWQGLMEEKADWIAGFGPDGMLYDQIGGMPPYPCFDETHPHMEGRPSLSYTQGRLMLLPRIRARAKTHGNEFAFFSEHITDLYSQFLDALHGINSAPNGPEGVYACIEGADGRPSVTLNYPELFRYCFPETIITVRNQRPYLAPRMVNYAYFYGFRYEMELRYAYDQEAIRAGEHQDWKAYAASVTAFRKAYADILLHGHFRADAGFVNRNHSLAAARYEGESRCGIAVWNDTPDAQAIDFSWVIIRAWASPTGSGEGCPETLQPGQIALLLI